MDRNEESMDEWKEVERKKKKRRSRRRVFSFQKFERRVWDVMWRYVRYVWYVYKVSTDTVAQEEQGVKDFFPIKQADFLLLNLCPCADISFTE